MALVTASSPLSCLRRSTAQLRLWRLAAKMGRHLPTASIFCSCQGKSYASARTSPWPILRLCRSRNAHKMRYLTLWQMSAADAARTARWSSGRASASASQEPTDVALMRLALHAILGITRRRRVHVSARVALLGRTRMRRGRASAGSARTAHTRTAAAAPSVRRARRTPPLTRQQHPWSIAGVCQGSSLPPVSMAWPAMRARLVRSASASCRCHLRRRSTMLCLRPMASTSVVRP
mmetsp:Transcript_8911/g.24973  ORF Transcript_8911/g.24973 Transcript_8911/m.24973 type:complete len:235 (+) Transcript_8911:1039-1743(+)